MPTSVTNSTSTNNSAMLAGRLIDFDQLSLESQRELSNYYDYLAFKSLPSVSSQTTMDSLTESISEAEKQSILQGIAEIRQGKGISNDEVKGIYEKWL